MQAPFLHTSVGINCFLRFHLFMCFLFLLCALFVCFELMHMLFNWYQFWPLLFVCCGAASVMDSSRRLALARTLKSISKATARKAGALDAPSEAPHSPSPQNTTTTTDSPHSLQTTNSPPPIAAVPLAAACTPALVDLKANQQDQEEVEAQIEDVHGGQSPPQMLTRSMFKALGSRGQLFSLFVISLVGGA